MLTWNKVVILSTSLMMPVE